MSWHDYLALALIGAAAAYLAVRTYRTLFSRAKSSCGTGCGSCGGKTMGTGTVDKLIAIEARPAQKTNG